MVMLLRTVLLPFFIGLFRAIGTYLFPEEDIEVETEVELSSEDYWKGGFVREHNGTYYFSIDRLKLMYCIPQYCTIAAKYGLVMVDEGWMPEFMCTEPNLPVAMVHELMEYHFDRSLRPSEQLCGANGTNGVDMDQCVCK